MQKLDIALQKQENIDKLLKFNNLKYLTEDESNN